MTKQARWAKTLAGKAHYAKLAAKARRRAEDETAPTPAPSPRPVPRANVFFAAGYVNGWIHAYAQEVKVNPHALLDEMLALMGGEE